jgi:1,4-alpha-glucan branching enzyme
MTLGGFTFVLHTHMPFYRGAGKWPHGEENLHEVMAETYIPLLEALTDLYEEGVKAKVTLGITPVLAEQLADALIKDNFELYVGQEIEAAEADVERFEESGEQHFLYLAHFYLDYYRHILQTFRERFERDLIGAFRRLQDVGVVEILTSGSTHPYMPLMSRDSTISAHLEIGKRATERHFGRPPRAIWLPECAYRPGYDATGSDGSKYRRPGVDHWLDESGLSLFFSESTAVEESLMSGKAERHTHEVINAVPRVQVLMDIYGQVAETIETMEYESAGFVTEKHITRFNGETSAGSDSGTFDAYYVNGSDVAVMGRNRVVGEQVWAASVGYPGDGDYREFHRKDPEHGLQYWRVTDNQADLQYKQPYDPFQAGRKAQTHADHFVSLVESQLQWYADTHEGKPGFIASAYDTELFGHWWFEGVTWLKEVLTRLAANDNIELCTASEWLEAHPPEKIIDLPESSWGHAGTHVTWINPETSWMWEAIHSAERRMEGLVERYGHTSGEIEEALNQAARELVLLEASDWEFLYTTGQARQYAGERFVEHVNRFNALADAVDAGSEDDGKKAATLAREYCKRDNLFPDIDFRLFASRQPV